MREKAAEGRGLYRPEFEHDACGIGAVVDIQGRASHETVDDALKIVEKLEHRAGKDAEGKTGDGVGILTQIPHAFFARAAAEASIALPGRRDYGVGMFFLPRDGLKRRQAQRQFELVTEKEGMAFLGWREVPVHPEILGQRARDKMPSIFQAFVARPEETAPGLDFDRKLYVARRVFEHLSGDTYVVSLSSRTVVYKGMFLVHRLGHRPLPVLDQHQPLLGAGPPQPANSPQRGDQHHPGQHGPDAGPGGDHVFPPAGNG